MKDKKFYTMFIRSTPTHILMITMLGVAHGQLNNHLILSIAVTGLLFFYLMYNRPLRFILNERTTFKVLFTIMSFISIWLPALLMMIENPLMSFIALMLVPISSFAFCYLVEKNISVEKLIDMGWTAVEN